MHKRGHVEGDLGGSTWGTANGRDSDASMIPCLVLSHMWMHSRAAHCLGLETAGSAVVPCPSALPSCGWPLTIMDTSQCTQWTAARDVSVLSTALDYGPACLVSE